MTSVFSLEGAYRRSLKLSCAPGLCRFYGSPLSAPAVFVIREELKASCEQCLRINVLRADAGDKSGLFAQTFFKYSVEI